MVRVSLSRAEVAAGEERGLHSPGLCVDFLCKVCLHGPHRKHPRTIRSYLHFNKVVHFREANRGDFSWRDMTASFLSPLLILKFKNDSQG